MRISTTQSQLAGINALLDQQLKLNKTQQQIATGKRVLNPSDDPAAAAKILDLNQIITVTEQYQQNISIAEERLGTEEQAIKSVVLLLQRTRELALQANSGVHDPVSKNSIAVEIQELKEQLLTIANTKGASGDYIFSGFQGDARPFSETAAGTFPYAGDEGQVFLQIGPSRQVAVSDSGTDVFRAIKNGNGTFSISQNIANTGSGVIDPGTVVDPSSWTPDTYTITFVTNGSGELAYNVFGATAGQLIPPLPADAVVNAPAYVDGASINFAGIDTNIRGTPAVGDQFVVSPSANQDVFTTLENMLGALNLGGGSAGLARFANEMASVLIDLDRDLENFIEIEGNIGARLNAVDTQKLANEDLVFQSQTTLSSIEDIDIAQAASDLNTQLVSLQAAQQAFIRVQNLSLFNFL